MIKTILVPVGASGVDGPAFGVAAHLAKLFTAHIDFLFARPEPITAAAVYGAVIPGTLEQLRAAAERQHQQMKDAYLSACERARIPTDIVGPAAGKVTARWHRETGPVASWVASYGRTSDLLIVPRPGSDDFPGAQGLEGALLESGRPVLIPSSSRMPPVETIAIAWKSSRESARAVTAARPFLSFARRILIINSGAGSASPRPCPRFTSISPAPSSPRRAITPSIKAPAICA